jgi:uncharacterized protein (UPF0305 family)
MTKYNLGDCVEVIPTARSNIGDKFKISQITREDGVIYYTDKYVPWFTADEIRLADTELKIGDWAKVVGPSVGGKLNECGKIFEIAGKSGSGGYIAGDFAYNYNSWVYMPESLRKLTPEEIQKHKNPKLEVSQEVKEKIGKLVLEQMVKEASHRDEIEKRLDRIEKNEYVNESLLALEDRISDIERQQNGMDKEIDHVMVELLLHELEACKENLNAAHENRLESIKSWKIEVEKWKQIAIEERAKQLNHSCKYRVRWEFCDQLNGSCNGYPHMWESCPIKEEWRKIAEEELNKENILRSTGE